MRGQWKVRPKPRNKNFEKSKAPESWSKFNKEVRQAKHLEHVRKSAEGTAKLERMRKQLEHEKELHADKLGVYYDGDERCHPIKKGENSSIKLALKKVNVTEKKLMWMLKNPETYPNLRLVYSFWENRWYLMWDGK